MESNVFSNIFSLIFQSFPVVDLNNSSYILLVAFFFQQMWKMQTLLHIFSQVTVNTFRKGAEGGRGIFSGSNVPLEV